MTEEYASMKQIEFMKKLGFPPQPTTLTKQEARQLIQEKLEERDEMARKETRTDLYGEKVDAPVHTFKDIVRIDEKGDIDQIKRITTKEYHLSPEEVKCRALESAIEVWRKDGHNEILLIDGVLETADKFVEWINA